MESQTNEPISTDVTINKKDVLHVLSSGKNKPLAQKIAEYAQDFVFGSDESITVNCYWKNEYVIVSYTEAQGLKKFTSSSFKQHIVFNLFIL